MQAACNTQYGQEKYNDVRAANKNTTRNPGREKRERPLSIPQVATTLRAGGVGRNEQYETIIMNKWKYNTVFSFCCKRLFLEKKTTHTQLLMRMTLSSPLRLKSLPNNNIINNILCKGQILKPNYHQPQPSNPFEMPYYTQTFLAQIKAKLA